MTCVRPSFRQLLAAVGVLLWLLNLSAGLMAADATPAPPPAAPSAKDLKAAALFARDMESHVAKGDLKYFTDHFNFNRLVDATVKDIETDPAYTAGFRSGVCAPATRKLLFEAIVKAGAQYKFIRVHVVDGQVRALFRLVPEVGVNFHDFVLAQKQDGEWEMVDMYVLVAGELISRTLRRAYLPGAVKSSKNGAPNLTPADKDFLAHFDDYTQMANLVRGGKYAEAMKVYDKMPLSLQQEKTVLLMRMAATVQIGVEEYQATLAQVQKLFPNDPGLRFAAIDSCFLTGNYAEVGNLLDQIEAAVGVDPYLEFLRATAQVQAGELLKARTTLIDAHKVEPDLLPLYPLLLDLAAQAKDYQAMLDLADEFKKITGKLPKDFETRNDYADFRASDAYKKWHAAQTQPAPEPQAAP